MAVQAQYPSTILLPAFQNRIGSIDNQGLATAAGALHESQSPPAAAANWFRVSHGGLNFVQQSLFNGQTVLNGKDSQFHGDFSGSRKTSRQSREVLNKQMNAFIPMVDPDRQECTSLPNMASQHVPVFTGLRLSLDDAHLNIPNASAAMSVSVGSSVTSFLSEELQTCMSKQRKEVEQLIKIEGERVKQAVEETTMRHARALSSTIEEAVSKRLKSEEDKLHKAKRRNVELQEKVKQLSRESQLWQNVARNSELMAFSLRNSLEKVFAQSREQSKEGCGESEVDDAESCQFGEGSNLHSRAIEENKELKVQRACRVCRTNNVCILLLPCRHLCLCKDCEGRQDACPHCGTTKSASVQVYMS